MEGKSVVIILLVLLVGFMLVSGDFSREESSRRKSIGVNHYSGDHTHKEKIVSIDYNPEDFYDNYLYKKKTVNYDNSNNEPEVIIKTIYIEDDNEYGYPVYDYRHGYTYRTSDEYLDSHKKIIVEHIIEKDFDEYYYYEYIEYLDEYQRKTCYKNAPSDKLSYTKCPGY